MRSRLTGGFTAPKRRTRYGAILGAGIAIAGIAAPATAETFAIDGDDICVGGTGKRCAGGADYRLNGVDAFESGQSCTGADSVAFGCGAAAKKALDAIIAGRAVSCVPVKRDGKRWIGNCRAGALDIDAEMVRSGWAFVRPDFLSAARAAQLCAIEAEARLARRGLWAGAWAMRPYFQKGGKKKTLAQISCPPHDGAAVR